MIHAIITSHPILRETVIDAFSLHPHKTDPNVWQNNAIVLIFTESQKDGIETATGAYSAEKIWLAGTGYAVDTERRLGDIVLPNVFFAYEEAVGKTEFTLENRDSFVRDALFLSNYETQSDVDFEHFGLSIGGINVSVPEYDETIREPMEFAYSADSADTDDLYSSVMLAKKLDKDETLHPILAIVGTESSEEEKRRIFRNLAEVIRFLQSEHSDVGDDDEESLTENEDEEN